MKALLVNGSPHKDGCTFTALTEVVRTLHKHDIETDMLYLGKGPILDVSDWSKRELEIVAMRDGRLFRLVVCF